MRRFKDTQETLGLMVNGLQIQAAHMRRDGDTLTLLGMERATLIHKLNEENTPLPNQQNDDFINLEGLPEPDTLSAAEPETNREILHRLLNKFPISRCHLSIALMETCVFYSHIQVSQELKGKKRQRYLQENIKKEYAFSNLPPTDEQCAFFEIEENNYLSIVQEDPLELLGLIDALKPFIGTVPISLIDTIEIALMDLVQSAYNFQMGLVAIVYIGEEFSRIIFMKNGMYLTFSQPIHEGFRTPKILRTLCRRLLYEQDATDIPAIDHIILTGACRALKARPLFAKVFPNTHVEYLTLNQINIEGLDQRETALISIFAVPIGLARKALCKKKTALLSSNFLPKARKRQQNPFEMAWHGLLLLIVLLSSTLLMGIKAQEQNRQIDTLNLSIHLLQEQIDAGDVYVTLVDSLKGHIQDYKQNLALIDTLSTHKKMWSTGLHKVATTVHQTGHVWLNRFSTVEAGIDLKSNAQTHPNHTASNIALSGVASRLSHVPRLAEQLGKGMVQSTTRSEIRKKAVYEFHLKTPVQHLD